MDGYALYFSKVQYSRFSCIPRDCLLTGIWNISWLSEGVIENVLDSISIKDLSEIQATMHLTWGENKKETTLLRIKITLRLGRFWCSSDLEMVSYVLVLLKEIILWVCFMYYNVLTVRLSYRTCLYSELYCVLAFWLQAQYLTLLELSFLYMPKGDTTCLGATS